VAAGTAGLAAAVAASEGGSRVIVCEKTNRLGGAGNMASGLFAVESRFQKQMQLSITKEEIFNYHMTYTHWQADAKLVKTYYDRSADTIDWLEKMGVEFLALESHGPGNQYTWHIVKANPPMSSCRVMMKILADKAKKSGVQFLLKTPANSILKSGGKVAGVMAENASGEKIKITAKSVIIATGGFHDNPQMIKQYTGFDAEHDIKIMKGHDLTGDGLRMAWEAGAAQSKMIMHMMQQQAHFGPATTSSFLQPNLLVNLQGERFINEEVVTGNNMFTGNAIALQKDKCAFCIIDEDTKNYYIETGLYFETVYGVSQRGSHLKATGFDDEVKAALANGDHGIFVADTLEELALKTGIDPKGLLKTIAEYNRACETGRDALFDRKPRYLRPVKQPKFYAFKYFLGAFGTLGGIKINYKTEVLDKQDDVIPGLYAAGSDAEAIYGDTYTITLPGNTMGFAINSGRMAGENAAAYVKSIVK
jgi:fumarate reductase flavoprotein subunit